MEFRRTYVNVLYLLCATLCRPSVGQDDGPVVDTQYGPVQGRTILVNPFDVSVDSFHGVYYARAPVGDLRFAAPLPPDPWDEVRDATELGPSCIQPAGSIFLFTHPLWNYFSEDCLHLDVYAPTDKSQGPLPVMVWIHGGGFTTGANIQYLGQFLSVKDVVVVVPNYRLGNLGFLYTGDAAIPGNAGMLDQVMALEWVRDNIANFGGDPDQVTIFGESAGGASVGFHVVSPLSSGLFGGAILESGTELGEWPFNYPGITNASDYTFGVAEELGCPTVDTGALVQCLREADARDVYDAGPRCDDGDACPSPNLVVDGEGGFLPDTPHNLRNAGNYNRVPEIVMHLSEDGTVFGFPGLIRWNVSNGFTRTEFLEIIGEIVDDVAPNLPEDVAVDVRAAMDMMYAPWPYIDDVELNRENIGFIFTDYLFGYAADTQARTHALENTVYQAVFGYVTDGLPSVTPDYLGCFHAQELPAVFGYAYLEDNPDIRNDTGMYFDPVDYGDFDREYFDFISTLWTNFGKFRNPTPQPVKPPRDWPEVTWEAVSDDSANYLWLDNEVVEMRRDYRQPEYAFWREYLRCMVFGDRPHAPGFTACESSAPEPPLRLRKARPNGFKPHRTMEFDGVVEALVQEAVDVVEYGGYE